MNLFKKKSHLTEEEDIYRDRYVKVPKKQKRKITTLEKALLGVLGFVVLIVLALVGYYLSHYYFYNDYRNVLSTYQVEEAKPFEPIVDSNNDVEGMVLAVENEYLKLYTNTETAEIAVYDKRNKTITYSNPVDVDSDEIANDTNKNYLKSQLIVEYFNTARNTGTMDSYSQSVQSGNFEIKAINNGIRYTYLLGDTTNLTGVVPKYIRKATLDKVYSDLDEETVESISKYFTESTTMDGFMELTGEAVKDRSIISIVNAAFIDADFDADDYLTELNAANKGNLITTGFSVDLEYRLDGDSLVVSVPMDSVLEGGGAKIYRIQLLKFFGATGIDDKGYMVVPNASGSIINFNNGKTNQADYSQYIYGLDPISQDYTVMEKTEKARLPIFGISKGESNVFATIEDGASLSFVNASVSGKVNSYNYVYPTFVLRGYDILSMFGSTGNEAELPIVESEYYDCNLTVRYSFMDEKHMGYAGMANYYREKLIANGVLKDRLPEKDIPLFYDVIGGVKRTSHILGVQYLNVYPMTTFEEAAEISNDLASRGVSNQIMNYQGWFNGGYYHDVANKVRVTGKLGGKSGFEKLNETVKNNGGTLYGDVALMNVSFVSKRYISSFESSRYYGAGYVASFGAVNPATLRQTSSLGYKEIRFDIVSPKFLPRYVDGFVNNIQKIDVDGISLRDLGDQLSSDRKRTNVISREEGLDVVKAQFDKIDGTEKKIMVSGGNDYSFAYADAIVNVPLNDNNYFMVDEDIPFYEMVIHGYIDYCGTQLNVDSTTDINRDILNMVEYGAAPHFIFTKQNSTEMKYTGLNKYYSTTYANWSEETANIYKELNEVLKPVASASIVNHEIISDTVRKVTYDNDVVIYINYGDNTANIDGIKIDPMSYKIGGAN